MERTERDDWDHKLFDNLPKMSTRALPCPSCDEDERIAADAPRASEGEVAQGMAQMPDGDREDDDTSRLA